MSALQTILLGLFLAILGVVLPFFMVLHVIQSTFFLNFFSYGASTVGLILGFIGVSRLVKVNKKK